MNAPHPGRGPLQGLRVLDIATIVAAPSAAALLADYGAEVLKVELPGGDGCRSFPPHRIRRRSAPSAPCRQYRRIP